MSWLDDIPDRPIDDDPQMYTECVVCNQLYPMGRSTKAIGRMVLPERRMNPDTLRKAVEYADGWDYSPTHPDQWVTWPCAQNFSFSQFKQVAKDALAAQLVRQIDAMNDGNTGYYVNEASNVTAIYAYGGEGDESLELGASGPDRTENTINACVQFFDEHPELLK